MHLAVTSRKLPELLRNVPKMQVVLLKHKRLPQVLLYQMPVEILMRWPKLLLEL